jgi:hypothetical protein
VCSCAVSAHLPALTQPPRMGGPDADLELAVPGGDRGHTDLYAKLIPDWQALN